MGVLEQGARNQRGLCPTGLSLKGLAGVDPQGMGRPMAALGAAKPIGPAHPLQFGLALCLATERLMKCEQ